MRINFFGGPGSGKSTTAAWLFSELKREHYSVELVMEYVKSWATMNRPVNKFDQVYLFGKQCQYEYRWLSHGVKNIVTDSPTFLSSVYARKYMSKEMAHHLSELNKLYDEEFPCVNIFLKRNDKPYQTEGRYQNREEAEEMDALIYEELMTQETDRTFVVDWDNTDIILELAKRYAD
jgi:thymidylate kinase